ncbi:hypothetical protein MAPG_07451 [Magnaporthiopsis poae ATCC 64411]|uniref:Uncharacterized protein n=1 Tax=Magnaporthiopsis poae (strain ATCC 64411 / 73-15) TaxID=644358 RepID=A0A0C4E4Q2_MAGP6|nr:hypothetical protein MAPG_07451 [Magnaporthiopsis poae ATCC 64411]
MGRGLTLKPVEGTRRRVDVALDATGTTTRFEMKPDDDHGKFGLVGRASTDPAPAPAARTQVGWLGWSMQRTSARLEELRRSLETWGFRYETRKSRSRGSPPGIMQRRIIATGRQDEDARGREHVPKYRERATTTPAGANKLVTQTEWAGGTHGWPHACGAARSMGAGSLSKLTIRLNLPGANFVVWKMVRVSVFVLGAASISCRVRALGSTAAQPLLAGP